MTPFESLGRCKGFKRVKETKGEAWQIALPFLRTVSFNWLLGHNLPGLFFASSSCSWGHLPAPAPQKNTHTHTHTNRIFKKSIQAYFQNTPEKSRFFSKVYRDRWSPQNYLPWPHLLPVSLCSLHSKAHLLADTHLARSALWPWPLFVPLPETVLIICAWLHPPCLQISVPIPADRSSLTTEIAALPPSLFLPPVHHHWLYLSCVLSVCRWNVIFIKTGTASVLSL